MKMITPGFPVCAVDCHGNPWDHGMFFFLLVDVSSAVVLEVRF